MNQGNGSHTLWAQLVELEDRQQTDQLTKARLVDQIIAAERLGIRDFAKKARDDYGLDGLSHPGDVSRLLSWGQLIDLAREKEVLEASNIPAMWTLRSLFAQHVPVRARLDLLAASVDDDGKITAKSVRAAVNKKYPKPAPQVQPSAKVAVDEAVAWWRAEWKRRSGRNVSDRLFITYVKAWLEHYEQTPTKETKKGRRTSA